MLFRAESLVAILLDLLFHFEFHLLPHLAPMFHRQLQYFEGVPNEVLLDLRINASICAKTRRVIHLNHPRFQLLIEHDVKAKQFKANVWFFGLTTPINVLQLGLHRDDCLENHGLNLVPNLLGTPVHRRFAFSNGRLSHNSLENISNFEFVLAAIKSFVLLIQRIVRQVRVHVICVVFQIVLFRG